MADEDAVGTGAGQAPEDAPQVEAVAPDESTDIVTEDAPDVEASVEPEAVTEGATEAEPEPAPPDLSGLTPTQFAEIAPDLAEAVRNAGAQAREAQLRREAGSRDQTRERVRAIKARLADIADDDAAGLDFVYDNAAMNAQEAVMRQMAQTAIETFNPDPEERQALESAVASLEGDAISQYAARMVGLAADRVGRRAVYEMDIKDIPADSRLAQSALARQQAAIEAEAQADAIESKPKRGDAPPTPAGRPVGTNQYDMNDPIQVMRAKREGYFDSEEAALDAYNQAIGA